MKRLLLSILVVAAAGAGLVGCGAGDDKLDPRFQSAFDAQGRRAPGADAATRGQALPPGATPPPTQP